MIYSIENNKLKIAVNTMGAELYSIKNKTDDFEYLWQGNSKYWSGRAYNLFPVCGRMTNGKYIYKGKTYNISLHGFARNSEFVCIEKNDTNICFELKASAKTKKSYPFDFCFRVRYILSEDSLKIVYEVLNTGNNIMPFALGGHPGFNLPLEKGKDFKDYSLVFKNPGKKVYRLVFSKNGYLIEEVEYPLKNGCILPLRHSIFNNDAIFLYNTGNSVTLTAGEKNITVDYPDMKYIGFWHTPKTDAPYICIEPWNGSPSYEGKIDDIEKKRDIILIESGKLYTSGFTVTFN